MKKQRSFKRRVKRTPRVSRRGHARPASAHQHRRQEAASNHFDAPEVWHEPREDGSTKYVVEDAGRGYLHACSPDDIREKIESLPKRYSAGIEVVQLSRMTRKRQNFPCYGMQWGAAVYLYPIEDSLTEYYVSPPAPQHKIESKMYGGRWSCVDGLWQLQWTRRTIRDFYLHNILVHEIGHLNDDRNRSYRDRERYADWFAIEYGYRPWKRK